MTKIDGEKLRQLLAGGVKELELNKQLVDDLNVFPVPDGDTGTNMTLTLSSALREANACRSLIIDEVTMAFARGALRGARGNSGVISSQIFKGFAVALEGKTELTPKLFADCLRKGAEIAYSAVTKPKEGTILTVIRVMAEAATSLCRGKRVVFEDFFKKVLEAGEEILQKTPDMLPVLKKAGVVDAGGRGILTVFDGMYRTLVGEDLAMISGESVKVEPADVVKTEDFDETFENDYEHITFQYCTEFLVTHIKNEITTAAVDKYRDFLMTIGDCVLVIGGSDTGLIKTHVHTNHPDRALNAALNMGELDGIKIENMVEQHRKLHPDDDADDRELKDMAIISVCCGDGLSAIFKDLGADRVVEGGQTMNPSVDDILAAVNSVEAKNVFVLPNNSNIVLAANQAKELARVNVYVVPTVSMPEGIAATLAFDPEACADDNFDAMCEAIGPVQCVEITHAVRSTRLNGFSVKEGDIIGINGKKIIARSKEIYSAVETAVGKLADNVDMVTLYYGEHIDEQEAEAAANRLRDKFPQLEVACYYGGQPHYFYIISAE